MRRRPYSFEALLTLPLLIVGCGDGSSTSRGDLGDLGGTTFDSFGDGDGDTGDEQTGDGDGDPTGDGDGDPTGDGDGDPTGDGDGDPTGDGDGDPPSFCTPGASICSGDSVSTCLDDGT